MRGRARAARRGARGVRAAGRSRDARSARSPTRGRLRVLDGDELVGDMPVARAGRRVPALRPRAATRRPRRSTRAPRARARRRRRRPARRCSRCSARRTSPRAAGRSSSTTRSSARARCAGPRQADAAVLAARRTAAAAIAVSIDGNGRRVACDPYRGAVEAVLECARQPRLRRRRAARPHQLPQLRQPREAAHRLAAHARGRGLGDACRALGVPVVGGNVSLYNEGARRPDLPDAGRRHGRRAARRRARRPPRLRARGRRDRAGRRRSFAPSLRRLRAGEAARRGARRRAARRSTSASCAALHAAVREAVRAGALRSRPRRRRGRPRGRAGRVLPRRRRRRAGRPLGCARPARPLLFGEGPGAFVVSGPEQSLRAFGAAACDRHGRRVPLVIDGELSVAGRRAVGRPRGRPGVTARL